MHSDHYPSTTEYWTADSYWDQTTPANYLYSAHTTLMTTPFLMIWYVQR